MEPYWITVLVSAVSAIIGGLVAAAVAAYQMRRSFADSTRLALEAFERERRREIERQTDQATYDLAVFFHDGYMYMANLSAVYRLNLDDSNNAVLPTDVVTMAGSAIEQLAKSLALCHKNVWTRQNLLAPQTTHEFYKLLERSAYACGHE